MFADNRGSTVHSLDSHGYLCSFRFGADGAVHYSARYVETVTRQEEHDAGGASWRFTHLAPSQCRRAAPLANTSVLRWGGHVLCPWEGGDPYELVHVRGAAVCSRGTLLGEEKWPQVGLV